MQHRQELDGLRSIAVLAVLLFHARIPFFDGGFVGVDVFFVLSGYLVTSIILLELNAGTFSILKFYERRMRRILPALFFMLLCCVPLTWFILIPEDFLSFYKSLRYTLSFISNIFFFKDSGYFAQAAELKPLLHTWSLAIEIQYYFIAPIVLFFLATKARKWCFPVMLLCVFASFVFMSYKIASDASYTFFMLQTRFWELGVGALIAFLFVDYEHVKNKLCKNTLVNNILSMAGLICILVAVLCLNRTTPFPSVYALLPTIGTGLIVIFTAKNSPVYKLLSLKLFVGIGLISYSVYLWHQPLLAFARIHNLEEISIAYRLLLIAASILCGYISWRWVEQPFRNRKLITGKQIFVYGAVGALALLGIALIAKTDRGFQGRFDIKESVLESFEFKHVALQGEEREVGNIKVYGNPDTAYDKRIAVFGDSHADRLSSFFYNFGEKNNVLVVHSSKGGCPPLLGIDIADGNYELGVCENLSREQYDFVKTNKLNTVVLVGRWSLYTDGTYDKAMEKYFVVSKELNKSDQNSSRHNFTKGLKKTIEAYQELGVEVIVVAQVPQQDTLPKQLYYTVDSQGNQSQALKKISVAYKRHLALQEFNRTALDELSGITIINPDPIFCVQDGECIVGTPEYSYYTDYDHLSRQGAKLVFDEIIEPYLPR